MKILIAILLSTTAYAQPKSKPRVDVACFNQCYKAMLENPKTNRLGGNIPWCIDACPVLTSNRPAIERE